MPALRLCVGFLGGCLLAGTVVAQAPQPVPLRAHAPQGVGQPYEVLAEPNDWLTADGPTAPPRVPHLVLREHAPARPDGWQDPTAKHQCYPGQHKLKHAYHKHLLHEENAYVTNPRATVPQANTIQRTKVPYSYGYFGAGNNRHWALHYGAKQDMTRWSKR